MHLPGSYAEPLLGLHGATRLPTLLRVMPRREDGVVLLGRGRDVVAVLPEDLEDARVPVEPQQALAKRGLLQVGEQEAQKLAREPARHLPPAAASIVTRHGKSSGEEWKYRRPATVKDAFA